MKTPICDFVQKYIDSDITRAHMPGHKGIGAIGCERYDITEVEGADVLYHSDGIIRESERCAASIFGTARTLYSCEGSSLSIRAMLYLALAYAKSEGRAPRVLAGRNAHKAFLCAAAMLDIDIEWLYGENRSDILSCTITPSLLGDILDRCAVMPCAVYITSPDYLGNIADIEALSRVCRDRGVLLLVDNAHGAYLHFLSESRHPISLGADICCDSAHKTLPVLTGGGYLHISKSAPGCVSDHAECAMALFASTSPSYLILQSLDYANKYMSDGYREAIAGLVLRLDLLKEKLKRAGYELLGDEPTKITLKAKCYGYTGEELASYLRSCGVEVEFSDPDYTVLMLSCENTEEDISRIERALSSLARRPAIDTVPPSLPCLETVLTPREAMLSPSREVCVRDAVGLVLSQPSVSCPPAIPVLVCGERIDEAVLRAFEYYGIDRLRVVEG